MGRPRKDPADRKDYHLRVPLNESQHATIEEAVRLADTDKAAWARAILLETAKKQIEKTRKSGRNPA
jgi:hypothetical protein